MATRAAVPLLPRSGPVALPPQGDLHKHSVGGMCGAHEWGSLLASSDAAQHPTASRTRHYAANCQQCPVRNHEVEKN